MTEQRIFGFVDPSRQRGGTAMVGVDLLHQPPMGFADFRIAGARLKPQNVIGFLFAHSARARRRSSPPVRVALDVVSPSGKCPVQISFQETE